MSFDSHIHHRTNKLKEASLRHGFMGVGISKAEFMEEEASKLEIWLSKGFHGEMGYMGNHFDKRVDPTKLVPGAKSVVSLMYNYYPGDEIDEKSEHDDAGLLSSFTGTPVEKFKVSRYAYGEDYHKVVRKKLKALVAEVRDEIGDFHGRVFVDSAPVLERDWAKRSGLGWIGKNTLLIHPRKGSYFFLAEIITDLEFEYDHPIRDHCGTCTRCIDACPTEAISTEGYLVDGSKCISYLTIELKSQIPESFRGKMQDWIFGCDICQEVCPWNRFSTKHQEELFVPNDDVKKMGRSEWEEITEEIFMTRFDKSPLKRAGYEGLKKNIEFIRKLNDE